MKNFLITNNPLIVDKLARSIEVEYHEENLLDFYKRVRDKIHKGSILLTHPLSGSVKPGETPYKTIMMSEDKVEQTDFTSISLIESAIATTQKLITSPLSRTKSLSDQQRKDFQLIDLSLILSAFPSSGIDIKSAELL